MKTVLASLLLLSISALADHNCDVNGAIYDGRDLIREARDLERLASITPGYRPLATYAYDLQTETQYFLRTAQTAISCLELQNAFRYVERTFRDLRRVYQDADSLYGNLSVRDRWRDVAQAFRRLEDDVLSGGAGPGTMTATVACQSFNYAYQECPVGGRIIRAQLAQQLSNASCTYGHSWDYTQRAIWVTRGCRGTFQVTYSRP